MEKNYKTSALKENLKNEWKVSYVLQKQDY